MIFPYCIFYNVPVSNQIRLPAYFQQYLHKNMTRNLIYPQKWNIQGRKPKALFIPAKYPDLQASITFLSHCSTWRCVSQKANTFPLKQLQ